MSKLKSVLSFKKVIISALTLISFAVNANVVNLTTEYTKTPIRILIFPVSSICMANYRKVQGERGILQTAYQLVVKDAGNQIIWDSGKITGGNSVGVTNTGPELKPATRYEWTVTVWDQKSKSSSASSWFETGLGRSGNELGAWSGATWIGGGNEDLVLYFPLSGNI